jgi:hypothetical protein
MSGCLLFFGMAIPYFHSLKRRQGGLLIGWLYSLSEDVLSPSRAELFTMPDPGNRHLHTASLSDISHTHATS